MGTKGDPLRTAAFERAWERSAEFRSTLRVSAVGWGVAFLADAALRVILVYKLPVARAVWMSNLPTFAALVILIAFSALMGRTTKRIVEKELRQMATEVKSS